MLSFSRILLILTLLAALSPALLLAQDCGLQLKGVVTDQHTGEAMAYVTVYERSLERGTITDDKGQFLLDSLCQGDIHLLFRHVGCEAVERFVHLHADTLMSIVLHHNAELLGEVEVLGRQDEALQVGAELISKSEIEARSDEDLTSMLTGITGLSAVQNGAGLAKPVYHGLSGNRLTILNQGIAQSGQQWGSDHAPEIDPFAADRLTVIQGVYTLAQNGANLGAMILVDMYPISHDPHLHGSVNYSFISNGAGHSLSSRLEKSGPWAAWRLSMTAKKSGDRHTPDYFLSNTANEQLNAALLIEKQVKPNWNSSLYLSSFNTEIGVLRGSHIGNLSDLLAAFSRDEPFFTDATRSYDIDNPRQVVGHQLIKFQNKINTGLGLIELSYAGQYNARQEFDVRRGGREDQAALDLDQFDHFLESSIRFRVDSAFNWRTGLQYRYTRNLNVAGTGILPLIPDYLNQSGSAFIIADWTIDEWRVAAGARYDYKNIYALTISQSVPRVIERVELEYTNPSAVATLRYDAHEALKLEAEFAYRQRSPEVNELFSNGLHQGVSGIEEGDPTLKNEVGLLSRISASYHMDERYFLTASAFANRINDFIYLVPQDELRLTIRGAFPVFKYQQVNAQLLGLDLSFAMAIGNNWRLKSSYALLQGREQESGLALIGIPSNNGSVAIEYEREQWHEFHEIQLSLSYSHTAERSDLLTNNESYPDRAIDSPLLGQDFLAAPEAYGLLRLDVRATRHIGKLALNMGLSADNLLNTRYRDYLDRQRYFADAMGRNIKLKLGLKF